MVQETEYLELFDGTTLEKDDVIDYLKSKYDQAYYNGLRLQISMKGAKLTTYWTLSLLYSLKQERTSMTIT